MAKKAASFFSTLLFWISLVVVASLIYLYRQNIYDWWILSTYSPSTEIQELADSTTMINQGRTDFFVSQPEIDDSAEFNSHCSNDQEQSVVLGCYVGQRIYLYNVTDARLNGIIDVTAAHEMLHAVYTRYSDSEKAEVDALINAQLSTITDEHILELVDLYNQIEPGELLNEMHSILGTEYADLSPDLEAYYAQFFSDRQVVVNMASSYQALFLASEEKIETLTAQMTSIKQQIDANYIEIDSLKTQIESKNQALTKLRSSDVEAYNAAVPAYNEMVDEYNNLVQQTKDLVDEYNQLVIEHNNEVAAQSSLYNSIDSQYQTISN